MNLTIAIRRTKSIQRECRKPQEQYVKFHIAPVSQLIGTQNRFDVRRLIENHLATIGLSAWQVFAEVAACR